MAVTGHSSPAWVRASRTLTGPDPGVPRVLQDAKSRKLAYSVCFRRPGENGSEGRLGPPDSVKKHGKDEKHEKTRKTRFLRVTRPVGQGYQKGVI